jgi:predicted nucleic acid-binding protein
MTAVIDTSCVIALDRLDLFPQASHLFSKLLVPKAVRNELYKRRQMKDRMEKRFYDYAFLERCNDYDQGSVDLLLIERARLGTQDRGEAEAVVQASQTDAMVIIDDLWGRTMARNHSLEYHGTLWVLRRLHELRYIGHLTCGLTFRPWSIRTSGFLYRKQTPCWAKSANRL